MTGQPSRFVQTHVEDGCPGDFSESVQTGERPLESLGDSHARGLQVKAHSYLPHLCVPQERGGLRGAGLDVFDQEPLAADSPLWGLENVLVTPHTSGVTPRFWERETDLILRNIGHYLSGRPLENLVDKEMGY